MIPITSVINLIFLGLLAFYIHKRVKSQPLGIYFLPGLLLKCVAGIILGLIYLVYYQGGDTVLFHEDATILARLAFDVPNEYLRVLLFNDRSTDLWDTLLLVDQPRALYMAKIVSVFHILTGSNYWISGFYLSFFAFSGLWFLANRLTIYFPWSRTAAIIGCLIFPSVIFWSSGITKESIATRLINWIVAIYIPLLARGSTIGKRWVFISLLMFSMLWIIKYYQAGILMAILAPTLLVAYIKNFSVGLSWSFHKQVLYWLSFLVWTTIIASFLHPNLRLDNMMDVVVDNYYQFEKISAAEDMAQFENLSASWKGITKHVPAAAFSGLFRPLPSDVTGLPAILSGVENLFLLILSIISLISLWRINKSNNGVLVIAVILYILVSAVLLAFAAPNYGTLVRYKSGFMPFFIYLVLADFPIPRIFRKIIRVK